MPRRKSKQVYLPIDKQLWLTEEWTLDIINETGNFRFLKNILTQVIPGSSDRRVVLPVGQELKILTVGCDSFKDQDDICIAKMATPWKTKKGKDSRQTFWLTLKQLSTAEFSEKKINMHPLTPEPTAEDRFRNLDI